MAFTTEYSFERIRFVDLDLGATAIDITSLAGGGVAVLGETLGHTEATILDAGLEVAGGASFLSGVYTSVDQLAGGDLVLTGEESGQVVYRITTAAGAQVFDAAIPGFAISRPDVAALAGGGFVVVDQALFDGSDHDIHLYTFDAGGGLATYQVVDNSFAEDQDAVVTGLADGGFAVAWTRTLDGNGGVEGWCAVYNGDGSVRTAPKVFMDGGVSTGMSIVALDTGGFAIGYQFTGWATDTDVLVSRFSAVGGLVGTTVATIGGAEDTDAAVTVLSNGLIGVSYSTLVGGDNDVFLQLIDPETGGLLLSIPYTIGNTALDETGSSAAALGLGGVAVSYQGGQDDIAVQQLVRTSAGDAADDVIIGDDAIDRVTGGLGDDILVGAANADRLAGGDGHDDLRGGDGDDLLDGGPGDDVLDGGSGVDTVQYADAGPVRVDLARTGVQDTGGAGADRLAGVENLTGGLGRDSLAGDGAANRLLGGAGNAADSLSGGDGADTLDGGAGADDLSGGAGDDLVLAGVGADLMSGGDGVDTLDYSGFSTRTLLDLAAEGARNTRSAGADTVSDFENARTGEGADRLLGTAGANWLDTAGGADTVKGRGGADVILAGAGDDLLDGGLGADTLAGGLGRDVLNGGGADDVFRFDALADSGVGLALCDVISDFSSAGGDTIDLSGILAGGELIFIGSAGFTGGGIQSEVRVGAVAEGQLIQVDLTGDGVSDMDILAADGGLAGGAADFIL
jgi:Ca2+-binding RTX toxin-like protein